MMAMLLLLIFGWKLTVESRKTQSLDPDGFLAGSLIF